MQSVNQSPRGRALEMNLSDLGRNIRWGVVQGAWFSGIASVVVTLFELPKWSVYKQHVWVVVGCYFAAGLGAGAIVGLLRPLTRRLIGALLTGVLAAIPFATVLSVLYGSTNLRHVDLRFVAFIALICGSLGGFVRWNQTWGRSGTSAEARGE
jgi:hypothetical protein